MRLLRFADEEAWTAAIVADFLEALAAEDSGKPFDLCLAGGSTPRPVYEALAALELRKRIRLWPGDERLVPAADKARNGLMIAEAFSACRWVPRPELRLWPEGSDGDAVAAAYAAELPRELPRGPGGAPRFALCLIGMGADGHVAGIFPGKSAIHSANALALPTVAPAPPRERVSLSMATLIASERLWLLARGREKLALVEGLDSGARAALPVGSVLGAPGAVVFWAP
jgi:6-phosphogluconolactonase